MSIEDQSYILRVRRSKHLNKQRELNFGTEMSGFRLRVKPFRPRPTNVEGGKYLSRNNISYTLL